MSLDKIIKNSVYEEFKKFGIIMLLLIPLRIIGGLEFIEVYTDLIFIGISFLIAYLFYNVNKLISAKKLLLFALNFFLAHLIYFFANFMDKSILISQSAEPFYILKVLIIFMMNFSALVIHIYAWNIFKTFIRTNDQFFTEDIRENAIFGSKDIILAIVLRIAVLILSFFISIPYADVFFILSMLILLLIVGSILLYAIGYIYLSSFRKVNIILIS